MPVDTTHTLHWSSATSDSAAILEQLQPNTLKGHVRDYLSVLSLHPDVQAEGRAFLRAVRVGFTAAGYTALGVTPVPADPKFTQSGA